MDRKGVVAKTPEVEADVGNMTPETLPFSAISFHFKSLTQSRARRMARTRDAAARSNHVLARKFIVTVRK